MGSYFNIHIDVLSCFMIYFFYLQNIFLSFSICSVLAYLCFYKSKATRYLTSLFRLIYIKHSISLTDFCTNVLSFLPRINIKYMKYLFVLQYILIVIKKQGGYSCRLRKFAFNKTQQHWNMNNGKASFISDIGQQKVCHWLYWGVGH